MIIVPMSDVFKLYLIFIVTLLDYVVVSGQSHEITRSRFGAVEIPTEPFLLPFELEAASEAGLATEKVWLIFNGGTDSIVIRFRKFNEKDQLILQTRFYPYEIYLDCINSAIYDTKYYPDSLKQFLLQSEKEYCENSHAQHCVYEYNWKGLLKSISCTQGREEQEFEFEFRAFDYRISDSLESVSFDFQRHSKKKKSNPSVRATRSIEYRDTLPNRIRYHSGKTLSDELFQHKYDFGFIHHMSCHNIPDSIKLARNSRQIKYWLSVYKDCSYKVFFEIDSLNRPLHMWSISVDSWGSYSKFIYSDGQLPDQHIFYLRSIFFQDIWGPVERPEWQKPLYHMRYERTFHTQLRKAPSSKIRYANRLFLWGVQF